METLEQRLPRITTITFDCYGTLIDWKGGLCASLRAWLGDVVDQREADVFATYVAIEAEEESKPFRCYRDILSIVAKRMGARYGVPVTDEQAAAFADSLTAWKPFPDTNGALARLKRRYRLGVLSNIDRDLFEGTCEHFDVAFDFVVSADAVKSYKPGLAHFQEYLHQHGDAESTLHVAQSLFHDGGPAAQLSLAYVWINRYNQRNGTTVRPDAEFATLAAMADAVGV